MKTTKTYLVSSFFFFLKNIKNTKTLNLKNKEELLENTFLGSKCFQEQFSKIGTKHALIFKCLFYIY